MLSLHKKTKEKTKLFIQFKSMYFQKLSFYVQFFYKKQKYSNMQIKMLK